MQFQVFVFADGAFAGTISPTPMDSRTDGTGHIVGLFGRDFLSGQFQRYTPTDPLCCPSSTFAVKYSIGDDQVLVPVSATRIRPP
jgi:hypothetical protein